MANKKNVFDKVKELKGQSTQEQENKISEEEKMENEIGQTRLVEDKQDKEQVKENIEPVQSEQVEQKEKVEPVQSEQVEQKENVEPVQSEQVEHEENNFTSILEKYKDVEKKNKGIMYYLSIDTAKKIELLSKEYGISKGKIISMSIELLLSMQSQSKG